MPNELATGSALHELDEIQVDARADECQLKVDLAVQGQAREQLAFGPIR
jgi:hypothetical protein